MRRVLFILSLAAFLLICMSPVGHMARLSLQDAQGAFTFSNYWTALDNPADVGLLADTFRLAACATALATFMGVVMAYYTVRVRSRLARVMGVVSIVPLLVPAYINAITWMWFLDGNGWINTVARDWFGTTLQDPPPLIFEGFAWAVFVLAMSFFPLVTLMVSAGLRSVDPEMEEAALVSRGPRGALFLVTLPMILPHAFAAAVFVFVFSVSSYTIPNLLRIQTYPSEVFTQAMNLGNFPAAVTAAVPLVGVTLLAMSAYTLVEGRRRYVMAGSVRPPRTIAFRAAHVPGLAFCAVVIFLAVVMPLGNLVHAWSAYPDVERDLFTSRYEIINRVNIAMSNMRIALRSAWGDVEGSVLLGAASATALTLLGGMLGYFSARAGAFPSGWAGRLAERFAGAWRKWAVPACMGVFSGWLGGALTAYVLGLPPERGAGRGAVFWAFSVVLGVLVAGVAHRFTRGIGRTLGRALEHAPLIPFAFPAVVVGVALIHFWNTPPAPAPAGGVVDAPAEYLAFQLSEFKDALYTSFWMLVIAAVVRFLPFSLGPVARAVRSVDPSVEEAAMVSGASFPRRLLRVVAPLVSGGLITAWVITFVLVVGELDIFLMVKTGQGLIPQRIFNAVHFGRIGVVAAWCLVLVAVIILPVAVYRLLAGERTRVL